MKQPLSIAKCVRTNVRVAKRLWPGLLRRRQIQSLQHLTSTYKFVVAAGDLQLLDGCWYVTHAGLLRLARRNYCSGIDVQPASEFCDPQASKWAIKAVVYRSRTCRGFVGYGDADPTNISPRLHGAEMRIAETRAVNRALRKAYAIGTCSLEEIGSSNGPVQPETNIASAPELTAGNGNGHLLRDRLCLLIRQHRLDPARVKAYAAEYCGVAELRDATREQIEAFVAQLSKEAEHDRDALVCHLNSYVSTPPPAQAEQSLAGAA